MPPRQEVDLATSRTSLRGIRMHCCLLKQPYQVCHVSGALWILNSRLRKPAWQRQLAAVTTWEGSSDAPFQGSLAQPLGVQSCSHSCGVVVHLPAVTFAVASCLDHEPACTALQLLEVACVCRKPKESCYTGCVAEAI